MKRSYSQYSDDEYVEWVEANKPKPQSYGNPIVGLDFTIAHREGDTPESITKRIRQFFRKYVFQEELGETKTEKNPDGYHHYQGRGYLIKKRRFKEIQFKIPGFHLSPTTKAVHKNNDFNYVLKADTRLAGPWSDKDYEEPKVLTRQLKSFHKEEMYGWQTQALELMTAEDDRSIVLIWDLIGNSGKSILCEHAEYNNLAFEMPPMRNLEDIMAIAMCVPTNTCYLVDMPRAMKKDKLAEFYSGLESLKNGRAYDKRYSFKSKRFDRPQVIVFTNVLPAWEFMSTDRWVVYCMNPDHTMTKRTIAELKASEAVKNKPKPVAQPVA